MVTFNRPRYTQLALTRLLESCDEAMRVWLWHNGTDEETLELVRSFAGDARVHRFHHSAENQRLRQPTNWLWENARGEFLAKVDDDCLVPDGWGPTLRQALRDAPGLGVVGCWRFREEDYVPELAERKIRPLPGGHRILQNCWVQGSSYLMRREAVERQGPLGPKESFITYCKRLAYAGWLIGWYVPFLREEHMDDPRSPYSLVASDEDLLRQRPLTAERFGTETVAARISLIRAFAVTCQAASVDPRQYVGWRSALRQLRWRLRGKPDPTERLDRFGVVPR
ncbi:MAG: glycosyltransferase family 2 protein [Thermoleophilia bacterium]|nr:glycosyltransferase family 2 protein [Thermoleophilia bacterium]